MVNGDMELDTVVASTVETLLHLLTIKNLSKDNVAELFTLLTRIAKLGDAELAYLLSVETIRRVVAFYMQANVVVDLVLVDEHRTEERPAQRAGDDGLARRPKPHA